MFIDKTFKYSALLASLDNVYTETDIILIFIDFHKKSK